MQPASPAPYYIQNADGTTSGPFYGAPPTGYQQVAAAGGGSPAAQKPIAATPAPVAAGVASAAAPMTAGVPSAAVPSAAYFPTSVKAAWDNHFEAFGKQDLDKIMLDYDQTSLAKVYNNVDGSKAEFKGTTEIREMFTNLFKDLSDLATLDAPVADVDEEGKTVFLVWKCPGCGYNTATDTFVFGPDFKIKRQNIVVSKDTKAKKADKTKKGGIC